MTPLDSIVLEGVTTHNLKSVDVAFPKGRLVVAAGVSGSGKSSLVIDTLFEHSKSLYLGALSSKTLDMGDGDYHFDRISGTQPPVALRQRDGGFSNPRSTVGTLSGLDGLYRLLFGAGARPVCPVCLGPTAADLRCPECGVLAEPHSARHFSPNRKEGKCLRCDGVGELVGFSLDRIIPDPTRTLREIWDGADPGTFAIPNVRKAFETMAADLGIDLDTPWADLDDAQVDRVLHGSDKRYTIKVRKVTNDIRFEGILDFLERAYRGASSAARRNSFTGYLAKETCPGCEGGRLRPESLRAAVAGHTFHDFQSDELSRSVDRLRAALASGQLPPQVRELASAIVKQSVNIVDVGLGHLPLRRPVVTLSGGELQRLLLAQHLASDLTGVMYVLDEPTAGLHESDSDRIVASLRRLRDLGNTVIVIEHDESVIRAADWVVELGPGAGSRGGEVVFEGPVAALLDAEGSPTAAALLAPPPARRAAPPADAGLLRVSGITRNNVRDATVEIPLTALTCVSGVSGAGKSSLVAAVHEAVTRAVAKSPDGTGKTGSTGSTDGTGITVEGAGALKDVLYVDQRAIGRSSRSTLATYIGVADHLRDAFAACPEAVERGLSRKEFSPNVAGGRCEACKGLGLAEIEMTLFRSESVICPECDGRRFQDHVLDVRLDGLTIHDVLSLSVGDALDWFTERGGTKIAAALSVLAEFGLGYLRLGSATTTLSGGEAQRLTLAVELLKQRRSGTLFIFDEPTRGLHPADIGHLMALFDRLVSTGNTILVIEHNLRVVALADRVIDIGPGAGRDGGRVLHCGPPGELAEHPEGETGRHLRTLLAGTRPPRPSGGPAHRLADIGELLPRAVTVVTGSAPGSGEEATPYGLTIGSLTVVSRELALVAFVVQEESTSWSAIAAARRFCVNVLGDDQAPVAKAFARGRPDGRFDTVPWERSAHGSPRLTGTYGAVDCALEATYRLGDHQFVLAKVVHVDLASVDGRRPLERTGPDGTAADAYGWRWRDSDAEERQP